MLLSFEHVSFALRFQVPVLTDINLAIVSGMLLFSDGSQWCWQIVSFTFDLSGGLSFIGENHAF